jgi:hypothetical protein
VPLARSALGHHLAGGRVQDGKLRWVPWWRM